MIYFYTLLCVLMGAAGQLFFKYSADQLAQSNSFLAISTLIPIICAFSFYGLSALIWIYILQLTSLGRIYPFMALTFLLVPLGSACFFGEKFSAHYFLGIALIMIGIMVTLRAQS